MLYRVVVDGTDILDYSDPALVLLSPQAEIEIDVSGSFEFTIPPNHKYYDWFTAESIMAMTIEVYEDTIMHWFGRPIELHLDFYKNKKIYCEGAMGFFNDSVIREAEYEDVALSTIFSSVISEHNSMVPSNRQFTIGYFTISDHSVYRKFNYEQTSDVLRSKFLDAEEGHFFVRRENGINYIDFLADMPYTCNQDVEFAENLLNFTYNFDGKDFATCVIPLGANDAETNKPITIESVNNGSDILIGSAATNYGKIVKVQHYSDLTNPADLLSEGQKYLTALQYNAYLIECSAVDLHSKDASEQLFRVGQKVTCISSPHGINLTLPISKMTLYLDSAAKQITLGRIPKKTLARFYKEKVSAGEGYGESYGEEEPEIPSGWEIVPPDVDGGEPTLKRVPVMINITHLPLQINYTDSGVNQYFDPNGIEVKLVAKGLPNLEYFTDEWYPVGVVPTSELRYEIGGMGIPTSPISAGGKVPSKAQIMVWVIWTCAKSGCPYIGKSFRKAFYIYNTDAAARDAENAVDHIVIEIPPTKLDYYDGEHINMSGAKVVAYTASGDPYTGNGYENGVIPNTELVLIPSVVDRDSAHKKATSDWVDSAVPIFSNPFGMNRDPYYTESENNLAWYYDTPVREGGYKTAGSFVVAVFNSPPSGSSYESVTHNGQTIYYKIRSSATSWNIGTNPDLAIIPNGIPTTMEGMSQITYEKIKKMAWTIACGDTTESQTIKIQWTAPETENTFEVSFEVTVKEGGIVNPNGR